jgi:hypothetical protein
MNATCRVIDALEPLPGDVNLTVVLSSRAPHLADAQRRAQGAITLMTDVADMAKLMTEADLAVGAAGSSAYERAALGLPTVMVTLADNQRGICELFAEAGAASDAGRIDSDFAGRLRTMIHGLMANAPARRQHARNPAVPSAQEHAVWMRRVLADPNVELMLVEADAAPAGMVRLDRLPGAHDVARYEVSIAIRTAHQNKGLASAGRRRCCQAADLHGRHHHHRS